MCDSKDKIPLCWKCRGIMIVFGLAVLGMWGVICYTGKPEQGLEHWVSTLIVMVTIVCTALPLYMNNRYLELEDKVKKQQEDLEKELKEDFENKAKLLIQNEKNIELKLQYKILYTLYNNIESNISITKSISEKSKSLIYLLISYILFYQLLNDCLPLIKSIKYKKACALIINNCFTDLNKQKTLILLYEIMNGKRKYTKIFPLIEYRDLFQPEFIAFLEEVKKREAEWD